MESSFDKDEKDFDKFMNVQIYINGLFLIENEVDKLMPLKINISNFQNYKKDNCEVFRNYVEEKVKKHIIMMIKKNCTNVIEISKKHGIPVKNVIYSLFINNRIDNIEIIWSGSALKEFKYVPINHYLDYHEDTLYLKTKKFKFKKTF
jgi:hypothetical protein